MAKPPKVGTGLRVDAVFVRVSTDTQENSGQKKNVERGLAALEVSVRPEYWFEDTVGRRKVQSSRAFQRLLDLVREDKIGTIYIESQDRWGTANRAELFSLIETLRKHGTRLYDLRAKADLTSGDIATELVAVVNSYKSEIELKDIAYRSLRTRVSNFQTTASWPTGPHPFGYGKRCYAADGKLRWEWQPHSRILGQLYAADDSGNLTAGNSNVRIPRKDKTDRIVLVPSERTEYVEAVRLAFELYAIGGLSRRQISKRLNDRGYTHYGKKFSHGLVTQILGNPAYVGDTHFGKTRSGELCTFDAAGAIRDLSAQSTTGKGHRAVAERIVQVGTHDPLIDSKTWKAAVARLAAERERNAYAPRNPAYYLKQLLVCGHCGRGMVGRTETHPKSGKKTVVYVCASYTEGRCGGHSTPCGYHSIKHSDAERLLLAKLEEHGVQYQQIASAGASNSGTARLGDWEWNYEQMRAEWHAAVEDGVDAFIEYLQVEYGIPPDAAKSVRTAARCFYRWPNAPRKVDLLPATTKLADAIRSAEQMAVANARTTLEVLKEEHKKLTLAWASATGLQQQVLKERTDEIEREIPQWEARTAPVVARLRRLATVAKALDKEREDLLAEYPALECRERGEAFRRFFKTVTLFWDRTHHPPVVSPRHPRKTGRNGRYSYRLKHEEIRYERSTTELDGSW